MNIRLVSALAATSVLAGCLWMADPGYSASAINRTDRDVVLRYQTNKWLLPAQQAGQIFATLGPPQDAPPIEYEVLDAATCQRLGSQLVDFGTHPDALVTIDANDAIAVGDSDRSGVTGPLGMTTACPGPHDGWSLWIVNENPKAYYVRTRGLFETIVAEVEPDTTRMAIGGFEESSTIELLDADCGLLSSLPRSGWGYFKGVIEADELSLDAGLEPDSQILSYGYVDDCGG